MSICQKNHRYLPDFDLPLKHRTTKTAVVIYVLDVHMKQD